MLNSLSKLENSKEYKNWKSENKNSYLCSCFYLDNEGNWQFDYYLPKKDRIKTFIVEDNKIKELKDSKIFKKDDSALKRLDLNKVKIKFESAVELVDNLKDNKYKNENVIKRIIILQNIDKEIWNITYLTSNFNILNIRIDANSGKILSERLENIMRFKAS